MINHPIDVNKGTDVIVIFGPTASGKSELAVQLAQHINGVIINADSAQMYFDLPILSNIPTLQEQGGIIHKLFGFLPLFACKAIPTTSPNSAFCNQDFSVGKWLKLVKNELENIKNLNKIPIVVGGSGLYISSLLEGISDIPHSFKEKNLAQEVFNNLGYTDFLKLITSIDPEFTKKFTDTQRLLRNYEVFLMTGQKLSSLHALPKQKVFPGNFINIFVSKPREQLYKVINQRFLKMVERGAITEVKSLPSEVVKLQSNLSILKNLKKVLGLYEISLFLNNQCTLVQAIEQSQTKTRQYAKRQLTWFNNKISPTIIINNHDDKNTLKNMFKRSN
ncbi:tRNA (adenosine(37)-N6)-dimethylallyltransferase MiaA [Candidatus Hepatincolaceae symbiont of Richtersius coronifer]